MIGLIAITLAVAPAKLMGPWLTFSRAPAFDRRVTTIDVGTLSSAPEWEYWFRRTVRLGNATQVWWTDTKRCPTAGWVLAEAEKLPPPRIDVPRTSDMIIMGDGVSYSVNSYAHYERGFANKIQFSSNVGTPLAAWVDESLRKLDPCWSKEPPQRG